MHCATAVADREVVRFRNGGRIDSEPKKRRCHRKSTPLTVAVVYNSSWLGRSKPLCTRGKKLAEAASSVIYQAFKADFVPMWHYQSTQGHRVSRLDVAQHQELHKNNPVSILCAMLSDAQRLSVQRMVLRTRHFDLMTMRQAVGLLRRGCSTDADDHTPDIMDMEAEEVAMLLSMARVSAAGAQLLAYNLGEHASACR